MPLLNLFFLPNLELELTPDLELNIVILPNKDLDAQIDQDL
jgi:hypothetical protein